MTEPVPVQGDGPPAVPSDDPFVGLIRQCQQCGQMREFIAELNKRIKGFLLIGTVVDPQFDTDLDKKNQLLAGPFRVHCEKCLGTGHELHPRGRRLMGVIKQFLDRAEPDWIKTPDDEIPF